jgi:hypothetical protein
MVNGVAEAVNSGNVNHSVLIGSQAGVRGLQDNLFRNRAQAYTNLEVRHAIPVAHRLALQLVAFSDLASFQRLTIDGRPGKGVGAANIGGGFRLIPTSLSNTMLRVGHRPTAGANGDHVRAVRYHAVFLDGAFGAAPLRGGRVPSAGARSRSATCRLEPILTPTSQLPRRRRLVCVGRDGARLPGARFLRGTYWRQRHSLHGPRVPARTICCRLLCPQWHRRSAFVRALIRPFGLTSQLVAAYWSLVFQTLAFAD